MKDRKSKIELVQSQAAKLADSDAAHAWYRLCNELAYLTDPESRPPRFNGLLRAIWVAATNEQS